MKTAEGDGLTPIGAWPCRRLLYRADRLTRPVTGLPTAAINPDDGWCDAPDDPGYNLPVRLPYPASTESLWRADGLYDIVIPLGFNDDPIVPGRGSAIFLHIAHPDFRPTEGCIALGIEDLLDFLRKATTETCIRIA